MAKHNELGRLGEKCAVEFLENKGYKILERNWHSSHKELDIIAVYKGWIVVAEVKTRSCNKWENPEEAVDKNKMRRIVSAANRYVKMHKMDNPVRFDVVSLIYNNKNWEIEHFEDAFLATDV